MECTEADFVFKSKKNAEEINYEVQVKIFVLLVLKSTTFYLYYKQ